MAPEPDVSERFSQMPVDQFITMYPALESLVRKIQKAPLHEANHRAGLAILIATFFASIAVRAMEDEDADAPNADHLLETIRRSLEESSPKSSNDGTLQ
jgi:hypothetical protein